MSIFNKSLKVKAAILMQLQDCGVSAIASLMSILCIRWLSDPIPGFKTMVIYWTLIGLFSTLIGTWLSGCHRVLAKWSTLRSYLLLARAVYVKEIIMIIMVLNNTIKFSNPSLYIVLILSDILLTSLFLCFIRLVIQFGHKEEIQRC